MRCDSYSCIGESHIASGKPCQDSSLHWSDEKSGVYIAIVCDGHGGDRYFRSDVGAKLLCGITKDSLVSFAESIKKRNKKQKIPLFKGRPFTQVPTIRESTDSLPRQGEEDIVVNQLLSSIVTLWREQIEKHASETPITDWEMANVNSDYLVDFEERRSIEKNYGSTLMAFLQTEDFWLAFHLGDGKCIMFDAEDNCFEPVLWDEKCFLNRTTSICDPAPIEEFRYSYRGDGSFPVAVFLGSDGIDDSYGDGERLHNFYLNILRMLSSEGADAVHLSLEESLPIISKRGSRDDMSVAFVYNDCVIKEHVANLTKKQIGMLDLEFAELKDKARAKKRTVDELAGEYERKRASLKKGDTHSSEYKACEKLRINLKYADSDYKSFLTQIESLKKQARSLYEFLGIDVPAKAYQLGEDEPNYLARITSFIDGSYGKECDKDELPVEVAPVIESEIEEQPAESNEPVASSEAESQPQPSEIIDAASPTEEKPAGTLDDIKRVLDEAVKYLPAVMEQGNDNNVTNIEHEETNGDSASVEMQKE